MFPVTPASQRKVTSKDMFVIFHPPNHIIPPSDIQELNI